MVCSNLWGSFNPWPFMPVFSLALSWILKRTLWICGILSARLSCLWNSVSKDIGCLCLPGLLALQPGTCQAPHPTESWNYHRAHLVHFPSLQEQYPSSSNIKCLKKQCAISFVKFVVVSAESWIMSLILSPRRESLIITAFALIFWGWN